MSKNAGCKYQSNGWCDHCFRDGVPTVLMGEVPHYETATAELCADCLRLGLATLESEQDPAGLKSAI